MVAEGHVGVKGIELLAFIAVFQSVGSSRVLSLLVHATRVAGTAVDLFKEVVNIILILLFFPILL